MKKIIGIAAAAVIVLGLSLVMSPERNGWRSCWKWPGS